MIGQENNIDLLIRWRLNKSIPRFIIIEGDEGSGRLTFSKLIISQLHATGVICDITKQAVNEIIENAYTITSPTVYVFRDADEMSLEAKNAMLKVMEEPPNKAYFIITIKSTQNMLETILSRGTLVKMQPYTKDQLSQFCNDPDVLSLSFTIGQCLTNDPDQCRKSIDLASEVIQNLKKCSGTGLLRSLTRLKGKDTDEEGINPILFYHALKSRYMREFGDDHLSQLLEIDRLLNYKSINKKFLIESTLIKILQGRKEDKK